MKVTDLDKVRDEKAPVCEYCGQEEHKGSFQCPRIKSVKYDNENDTVTVYLHGPLDLPSNGPGVA